MRGGSLRQNRRAHWPQWQNGRPHWWLKYLLDVGTPATEEVVINRSYIGYRGALTLLEKIYTATVGGK